MEALVWIGAAVTAIGLASLVWCIRVARTAKEEGLSDDEIRARIMRAVMLNMAAVGMSGLGLAMVVAGIFLSR